MKEPCKPYILGIPPEETGAGNQLARYLGERALRITPAHISAFHQDTQAPAKIAVDAVILGETLRQQMMINHGQTDVGIQVVAIGLLGGNPRLGDEIIAHTENIWREQKKH